MRNLVLVLFVSLLGCMGCNRGGTSHVVGTAEPVEMKLASMLRLVNHGDWTEALVVNPWDTAAMLQRLALVPRNVDIDTLHLPPRHTVVRTPLQRSLVTTAVHIGLLEELGAHRAIAGITDVEYIGSDSKVLALCREGSVVNCGNWMAPDVERIIKLSPDAIVLSPYQDGGNYAHLTDLGIPVVFAADYMENSPLGRAEWMKYYGLLFGCEKSADSLFHAVEMDYAQAKRRALSMVAEQGRPAVIVDVPYMGTWYVNGRGSANDLFITDAGGTNPFAETVQGTSVGISPEKFLLTAHDAQVWLRRYHSSTPMTYERMKAENPLYGQFKAFNDSNVWVCNTAEVAYFDETPFHPERLLSDLVNILHPGASTDTLRYFRKL